jgi:hypothetical protein
MKKKKNYRKKIGQKESSENVERLGLGVPSFCRMRV